jgi:hypothetical protein
MIGVVKDAGSGGIQDAVIGALQRWVRQERHLLESRRPIHDPTAGAPFMRPLCATSESADNLHGGFIDSDKHQRGIALQW